MSSHFASFKKIWFLAKILKQTAWQHYRWQDYFAYTGVIKDLLLCLFVKSTISQSIISFRFVSQSTVQCVQWTRIQSHLLVVKDARISSGLESQLDHMHTSCLIPRKTRWRPTHSHSERRVTESRVLLLVNKPTYERRATVERSNFAEMTEAFAIEIGRREHHGDRSKPSP